MGNKYAVLDLETTGFNYAKSDRILEIGVVLLDENFQEEEFWTTLINPNRDVSATEIHGISSSDVYHAPTFAGIARELALFLADRVLIGHNVSFDRNFLFAEYARLGVDPEFEEEGWFCTQALSKWVFPGLGSYSLENMSKHLKISNPESHAALSDARATAALLQKLIVAKPQIAELLQVEDLQHFLVPNELESLDKLERGSSEAKTQQSFVQKLIFQLPDTSENPSEKDYLDCLSRALLDGVLSEAEIQDLLELALKSGLSASDISDVHRKYFQTLVALAWADGLLTASEKQYLTAVSHALGIGEMDLATAFKTPNAMAEMPKAEFPLVQGSWICLTGTMTPDKAETAALLTKRGYQVADTLTKKVSYLVAADVNSLSGKAGKARQWGIPVVSSEWIWATFS